MAFFRRILVFFAVILSCGLCDMSYAATASNTYYTLNDVDAKIASVPSYFQIGTVTSLSTLPYKPGYGYAGHYTGSDCSGTQVIDYQGNVLISLDRSTTLYACWLAFYPPSIVFDDAGGSGGHVANVACYNLYQGIVVIGNHGVHNNGDYVQVEVGDRGGEWLYNSFVPTKSGEYYWGHVCGNPAVTSMVPPTRSGYTFKGYYTGQNGSGTQIVYQNGNLVDATAVRSALSTTAPTTIYAYWQSNVSGNYHITLNDAGGSGGQVASSTLYGLYEMYGECYASASGQNAITGTLTNWACISSIYRTPSRTGYEFGGYYTGTNGSGVPIIDASGVIVGSNTQFTSASNIYAKWTPKVFSVALNSNGGTNTSPSTVYLKYDTGWYSNSGGTTSITRLTTLPTKSGSSFAGFYTASSGGTQIVDANGVFLTNTAALRAYTSSGGIAYAQWTTNGSGGTSASVYTITLNASGSLGGAGQSIYEKYGYGWYRESAATNQITASIFDATGSGGAGLTKPTNTGTVFKGYYTGQNGSGTQIIDEDGYIRVGHTYFIANTIIYAYMESVSTSTVRFELDGGTSCGTDQVTAINGQPMPAVCVPTRTGYIFLGYYDKTNDDQYYLYDGTSAKNWDKTDSDYMLTAYWAKNYYKIIYSCGEQDNVGYGDAYRVRKFSETSCTTPSGKRFKDWSYVGVEDTSISGSWKAGEVVTYSFDDSVRVTPNYVSVYTVTLEHGSPDNNPSPTIVYVAPDVGWYTNSNASDGYELTSMTTLPHRVGATFSGYYTTASGGTQIIDENGEFVSTAISSDTTIYARYRGTKYIINLNDQGADTAASPTRLTFNTDTGWSGDVTTRPTKTGFRFGGYYTATGGNGVQIIDADGVGLDNLAVRTELYNNGNGATTRTVYANWVQEVTVTLSCQNQAGDGNGTPTVSTYQVVPGGTFTFPDFTGCSWPNAGMNPFRWVYIVDGDFEQTWIPNTTIVWDASWGSRTYNIWYAPNYFNYEYSCGTGSGTAPESGTTYYHNGGWSTAANTCTPPTNKVFKGWLESQSNIVYEAEAIPHSGNANGWLWPYNVEFVAQYGDPTYTATFTCENNVYSPYVYSGTAPADITDIEYQQTITLPSPSVCTNNYPDAGWIVSPAPEWSYSCTDLNGGALGGGTAGSGSWTWPKQGNCTFRAYGGYSVYHVYYHCDDTSGTVSLDQTVNYTNRDTIRPATVATVGCAIPTGHSFAGWKVGTTSTILQPNQYGGNNALWPYAESVHLRAQWEPDTYNLTWDCGSGTGTPSGTAFPTTIQYGDTLTFPENTVCTAPIGYQFAGWSVDIAAQMYGANAQMQWNFTSSSLVTASYSPVQVNITYSCGTGATGTAPSAQNNINYGSSVILASTLETCAKTGHAATKWVVSGTATSYDLGATVNPWNYTENKILTPNWSTQSYPIKYYDEDGTTELTGLTPSQYTYGTTTTINAVPTKVHSVFNGWCTARASNGTLSGCQPTTNPHVIGATETGAKTYYASWSCNEGYRKYTYDTHSLEYDGNYYETYPAGTCAPVRYKVTCNGNGGVACLEQFNFMQSGTVGQYSFGSVYNTRHINADASEMAGLPVPIRNTGNTEPVWPRMFTKNPDANYSLIFPWPATDSSNIVSGWFSGNYLTFMQALANESYNSGISFGRPHYTFDGLWTQAIGGQKYIGADGKSPTGGVAFGTQEMANFFTSDADVYAHWIPDVYTILLEAEGHDGTLPAIYETYNTGWSQTSVGTPGAWVTLTPAQMASKTGYTLLGYYSTASGTGTKYINGDGTLASGVGTTTFGESTALHARFQANTYNVTYSCGTGATGTAPASATATYNGNFTPASLGGCTNPGRSFEGWLVSGTTSDIKQPGTQFTWNYTEDKTFTAQWTDNTYTITFHPGDGVTTSGTTEVQEWYSHVYRLPPEGGTMSWMAITEITLPTKTGYTFAGYYDNASFTGTPVMTSATLPVTTPTATYFTDDADLYAKWTKSNYTVTYKNGGGTGADVVQDVTYDTQFTTKPGTIFTKTNSVVTKWNTTSGGSYPNLESGYTYSTVGNTVLTANWGTCTCVKGSHVTDCEVTDVTNNICQYSYTCETGYNNGGSASGTFAGAANTAANTSPNCGGANSYTITVTAGRGVSTVAASGWTNTGTATMTKTYNFGDQIDLSTVVTPTNKSGYTGAEYTVSSGSGSITNNVYTVGAGAGTITVSATGITAPTTVTISGGTTKVYNYSATTLTGNAAGVTYDSGISVNYSFGYSSASDGTYGNWTDPSTTNTISIAKNAFLGTRYYKARAYATDGVLSSGDTIATTPTTMTLDQKTITFNATANGGALSGTSPLYVRYDSANVYTGATSSTTGTVPTATKTGYTFNGWYNAQTGGTQIYDASGTITSANVPDYTGSSKWRATEDKTLYAQFSANTDTPYKVYHYTKNLTGTGYTLNGSVDNLTGTSGASVTVASLARTIDGFTYDAGFETTTTTHGTTKPTSGAVTTTTILANGTRIIDLYYNRNSYTVTLAKGTGVATVSGAGTYDYGATVNIDATMSNGYDWYRWTKTSGGTEVTTTKSYSFTMGAENVAYTANATVHSYNITYDLNQGTSSSTPAHGTTHPSTYKVTDATFTISNPTMTGYTFAGWTVTTAPAGWGTGSSSDGSTNFKIATGTYGDIALRATWTPNCNKITLDPNNGISGSVTELYKKTDTTGWFKNSTCTTAYSTDSNVVPHRDGYTLRGFYTAVQSDITTNASTPTRYLTHTGATTTTGTNWTVNEPRTLYAAWATNCSSVSNGSCTLTISGNSTTYTTICDEGYTLTSGASTYNPVCTANTNTITLSKNGGTGTIKNNVGTTATGTNNGSMTCTTGETVSLPTWVSDANTNNTTNITKGTNTNAKIFLGWATSNDATSGVFSIICPTASTQLYAVWGTPNCEVTNGSGVVATTVDNKPTCTVTCNTGYHTSGTYSGTNAGTTNYSYGCTANTITLTYNNGGHGTAPTTPASCTYGSTFNMPAAITATGYTFNKWTVNNNEFNANAQQVVCDSANLGVTSGTATITATWTAKTYTVTLNKNATDAVAGTTSVTATYDAPMPTSGVTMPSREGYVFDGYYDTSSTTGGTQYYTSNGASARNWDKTANTTLYARWTAECNAITVDNTTRGGTTANTTLYKKSGDTKWYSDSSCQTAETTTPRPTKTNAEFSGYYTSATDTTTSVGTNANPSVLSTTWTVTGPTTIYAHYNCISGWQEDGTDIAGTCIGTITAGASDKVLTYNGTNGNNGTAQSCANVTVTTPASDASVTYATKTGTTCGSYGNAPTLTNVSDGPKTICYKVTATDYATVTGEYTCSMNKADGNVVLNATSGTTVYPNNKTFTVTTNKSGGTLSVSPTSGNVVATASVNGTTVTATPQKTGIQTITVTSAETGNYNAATATYTLTVTDGGITHDVSDVSKVYDGTALVCNGVTNVAPSGATVKYRTAASGEYNLTSAPSITNVSDSKTIYYQITVDNYETVTGQFNCSVTKADCGVTLNKTSDTTTYNTPKTFTASTASGCTLSVSPTSGDVVATASISNGTVTVTPQKTGSQTVTVSATADGNHNSSNATYKLTVNAADFTVTEPTAHLTYNGTTTSNGSAQTCPGVTVSGLVGDQTATIKYGTASGTYNNTTPGSITNAGNVTVYYQVTAPNHNTQTGEYTCTMDPRTSVASASDKELTYTGSAQSCANVTLTYPTNGTIKWKTSANGTYDATVPTMTNVSESPKTIYYQVSGTNFTTIEGNYQCTMAKADCPITVKDGSTTLTSTSVVTLTYPTSKTLTATSSCGNAVTLTSGDTAYITVSDKTLNPVKVTSSNITMTASVAASANYNGATATFKAKVNRGTCSITLNPTSGTITYPAESTKTFTIDKGACNGTITATSDTTSVATVALNSDKTVGTVTYVAPGSATITVNSAQTDQYNAASATYNLTNQLGAYTITFKTGNKTMGTQSCTYGQTVTLNDVAGMSNIPVSADNGWGFDGWATTVNTNSTTYANKASMTCNGNATLYGVWKRDVKFKYFETATSTATKTSTSQQYYRNTTASAASANAVTTYPLYDQSDYKWAPLGWATTNSATSASVSQTGATTTTVTPGATTGTSTGVAYYAVYQRTPVIEYDGNDNTGGNTANTDCAAQTFNAGATNGSTPACTLANNGFTRTGYTFNKWAAGGATGTQYDQGATYTFANRSWTSSKTYKMYANWKNNHYRITLNDAGGSGGQVHTNSTFGMFERYNSCYIAAQVLNNTEFEASECINAIYATPTRSGYDFGGYYTDEDGVGDLVIDSTGTIVAPATQFTEDSTIYATWTANTITLTYNNGGHGTAPTTPASCTYGSTFNMPAAITATGYTFNKWTVNNNEFNANAQQVVCDSANLGVTSGTAIITATWNQNDYTMQYVCSGEYPVDDGVFVYTGTPTAGSNPITVHYLQNNVVMSGQGTCNYEFVGNDTSQSCSDCFTFGGWTIDAETAALADPDIMHDANSTVDPWGRTNTTDWCIISDTGNCADFTDDIFYVAPVYTPKQYNISYMYATGPVSDASANMPANYTYTMGGAISDADQTAPLHATFNGWCTNLNDASTCVAAGQSIAIGNRDHGDKTYYARWSCDAGYVLSYNANNEPVCSAGAITCDPTQYLPANSTMCVDCTAGNYCPGGTFTFDEENNQGINICPAGSFCPAVVANHTLCAVGSYTATTGQSVCVACQEGTTTSATGQTSCNADCPNATGARGWETAVWNINNTVTNACTLNACEGDYYPVINNSGNACELCADFADGTYPHSSRSGVSVYQVVNNLDGDGRRACFVYRHEINGYHIRRNFDMAATACPAGFYSNYSENSSALAHFGESYDCDSCPDNTYSTGGAIQCTACLENYTTYGPKTSEESCRIYCAGGYYLRTAYDTVCSPVGVAHWAAASWTLQGHSGTYNSCSADKTTVGYGVGADEVGDCGRILHVGNDSLYLRSDRKTNRTLNFKIENSIYYANMSTDDIKMSRDTDRKLKIKVEDTEYSVYDDMGENNIVPSSGSGLTLNPNVAATSITPSDYTVNGLSWGAIVSGTSLTGNGRCSTTTATIGDIGNADFVPNGTGNGCWCQITSPVQSSRWVYATQHTSCGTKCGYLCANNMNGTAAKNINYRTSLYTAAGILQ